MRKYLLHFYPLSGRCSARVATNKGVEAPICAAKSRLTGLLEKSEETAAASQNEASKPKALFGITDRKPAGRLVVAQYGNNLDQAATEKTTYKNLHRKKRNIDDFSH